MSDRQRMGLLVAGLVLVALAVARFGRPTPPEEPAPDPEPAPTEPARPVMTPTPRAADPTPAPVADPLPPAPVDPPVLTTEEPEEGADDAANSRDD